MPTNDDIWLRVPGAYCPLLRTPTRETAPTVVVDGLFFDRLLSPAEMLAIQAHLRLHAGDVRAEQERR